MPWHDPFELINFRRRVRYWKKKLSCDAVTAELYVGLRDVLKKGDYIQKAAAMILINKILQATHA